MGFDPGAFSNGLMRGLSVGQGLVLNAENRQRQQRLDAERTEDRQFQRGMLEKQEQRADQQFAWQKRQQEMFEEKYQDEKRVRDDFRNLALMEAAIENGSYDSPEFFQAFNSVFSDMINVGGPDGATKTIVGGAMTPDGKGFIPHLRVTTPDGKSYEAPATLPNRDATDTDVMVVPFSQFFASMGERKQTLAGMLKAKRAQLDPQGYFSARDSAAAEQRKYQREDLVDERKATRDREAEERKNAFELQKQNREYSLRHGLEAAKHRRGGSSGTGKTDLIQLRTGRTATLDDLRKSYVANYGKVDANGNLIGLADGSPSYEEWVNKQAAEPVFLVEEKPEAVDPSSQRYLDAKRKADQWVNSKAGLLSSDKTDFADYGGDRERARRAKFEEFYREPGDHPSGQGLAPPPQKPVAKKPAPQPKKQAQPKTLDPSNAEHKKIALDILKEAKGDKAKARQIAKQRGYSF
jgi:hypothetical protein